MVRRLAAPRVALGVACALGCGAAQSRGPLAARANVVVTLYHHVAIVNQRIELQASAPGHVHGYVMTARDVEPRAVVVIDRGGLTLDGIRDARVRAVDAPHAIAIDAIAPHAGTFGVVVSYATTLIPWDASYMWTTDSARERATLSGELAIHDQTGVAWMGAIVTVVDGSPDAVVGAGTDVAGQPLGRIDLAGELHVPIVHARTSILHPVLVFDPIGDGLDQPSLVPSCAPELGVRPTDAPLAESYELERDARTTRGLPTGTVRLVAQRPDGGLDVLGQAAFDAASRERASDIIAIGLAGDVRARREQRELAIDDDDRRIVEEFAITFDSTRGAPVHVIAREHMVRGANGHIAYDPGAAAQKERDQEVALRTTVPAYGRAQIGYVVVYTWDSHVDGPCR